MRQLAASLSILMISMFVSPEVNASVLAVQAFPAARATHPVPLNASLTDPEWMAGALPSQSGYENLTTRSPSVLPTRVELLYDDENLYVGFHADQGNTPITATQSANDIGFGVDDFVGIGIDPSGNGSQVYYFETNPRGVRYQQASENARYKPAWQAAAEEDGETWNAMMIIPLKALQIGSGSRAWRINFIRSVAAVGEHYTWAYDGLMTDGTAAQGGWPFFTDARFWPTLSDLRFATAAATRSTPRAKLYGLSSSGSDRKRFAQSSGQFLAEDIRNIGIDLVVPITNTINFVGTASPDFSNVEIDQQTIAPQEFRRGLQEYRPFFAQGANFINVNPAYSSIITASDLIFYSPGIGPFDRGEKVEGTFGKQSFGALNFRGYDQTTGNEFDDVAYGFMHAEQDRTFLYWADGVEARHSLSGNDNTNELGLEVRNKKTGLFSALDASFESGSWLPAPGLAHSLNGFVDVQKPNYEAHLGYEDVSPNYNPIDGFTAASDKRGPIGFATFSGSTSAIKNYALLFYGDRFADRSGQVRQADTAALAYATFKNGFSLNGVGSTTGILRSYALDDPSKPIYPMGCADANLQYGSFTGFPGYFCGRSDRFNLLGGGIGYRDGTPAPIDMSYNEGLFGSNYLHLFTLATSRPLGRHLSISSEFDITFERSSISRTLESQSLRRLTLGETLGQNANASISLRSISGRGGFAAPGINLSTSYHQHFLNGDELYVNFGTPAANQTLNRFVVKYVLQLGGAGT